MLHLKVSEVLNSQVYILRQSFFRKNIFSFFIIFSVELDYRFGKDKEVKRTNST